MHFPDNQPCRHSSINGFEVTKSIVITIFIIILIIMIIIIAIIIIVIMMLIIITANSLVSFLNLASINV